MPQIQVSASSSVTTGSWASLLQMAEMFSKVEVTTLACGKRAMSGCARTVLMLPVISAAEVGGPALSPRQT